jgi:hypothetical protein
MVGRYGAVLRSDNTKQCKAHITRRWWTISTDSACGRRRPVYTHAPMISTIPKTGVTRARLGDPPHAAVRSPAAVYGCEIGATLIGCRTAARSVQDVSDVPHFGGALGVFDSRSRRQAVYDADMGRRKAPALLRVPAVTLPAADLRHGLDPAGAGRYALRPRSTARCSPMKADVVQRLG